MNCLRASNYIDVEPPLADLHINSCGYFSEINHPTFVNRAKGRPDFQLIGVIRGKMKVRLRNEEVILTPGKALLFKPKEPQIYGMLHGNDGACFWIHFQGKEAASVLSDCGLYNGNIFDVGCSDEDADIVCDMISEITRKSKCYQHRTRALFLLLLTNLARRTPDTAETSRNLDKIRTAVNAMENDSANLDVKGYADMCHMSEYYFLHTFKATMGMTPMKYRNMIVMERAKTLVRTTDLSIKEIAQQCGFSDPLYLSKKFKSDFGYSPTEYRKRYTE